MKSYFLIIAGLFLAGSLSAQKYFTKTGNISFHSDAPMEKIEATNTKASSVVDMETGKIEWAVLIKAFQFEKALMQEHFNENYMESSKFPKAKFKGDIGNIGDIDFSEDGQYTANVSGTLEIHGVTNDIDTKAKFTVKEGNVTATSTINVLVADYDIEIPRVVRDNIAKEVEIRISADYKPLN